MFFQKKDAQEMPKKIEPKKEKPEPNMPIFCPLLQAPCNKDCAWLIDKTDEFVCAIYEIGFQA